MSTSIFRACARALVLALTGSVLALGPLQTAPAEAAVFTAAQGSRAVQVAATRRGSPYSYGAVGPRRFDCSGLTKWTFAKFGRNLPHSSSAQYGRTKHIGKASRRPGDLVFFHRGGRIYHVAIYAGNNKVWHAPYSGTRVRLERIWTGSVYYGRVR